jgi:hypothetical protein
MRNDVTADKNVTKNNIISRIDFSASPVEFKAVIDDMVVLVALFSITLKIILALMQFTPIPKLEKFCCFVLHWHLLWRLTIDSGKPSIMGNSNMTFVLHMEDGSLTCELKRGNFISHFFILII